MSAKSESDELAELEAIESEASDEDVSEDVTAVKRGFSTEQLKKDLQVRDTDIDSCMMEQAGLYGHYSMLYSKAQYDADFAKRHLEVTRAKLYRQIRTNKIARGVKFTEPLLESEVMSNPSYIEAAERADKARMAATLAKEALEALKQRRDMLVQIGKYRLEEFKGELYLKANKDTEKPPSYVDRFKRKRE